MTEATSLVRSITVAAAPADAFRIFTTRFAEIKPSEHNLLDVPHAETVLEAYPGGRIIDRGVDGSESAWARILAVDPPNRLLFTWDISPTWTLEPDLDNTSEVELTFHDLGDGRTRVDLEHRHLDRHGPGWPSLRDAVGGDGGWPLFLGRFGALADAENSVDSEV